MGITTTLAEVRRIAKSRTIGAVHFYYNGNRYEFTPQWVYVYDQNDSDAVAEDRHWFSADLSKFGKAISCEEIINRIENFAK